MNMPLRQKRTSPADPRARQVVVERAGRITGHATPIADFGHATGETNDDLPRLARHPHHDADDHRALQ